MSDLHNSAEMAARWFTDEDWWGEIKSCFDEISSTLHSIRYESYSEALGYPAPDLCGSIELQPKKTMWLDDGMGIMVRPWFQARFDPMFSQDEFDELRSNAISLIPEISGLIGEKKLTPRFLFVWGQFIKLGAILEGLWLSSRALPNNLKGSAAQSNKPQRVWYARVYLSMEKLERNRNDIDGDIAGFVENIIQGNKFPSTSFSADWYRSILSSTTAGELAASFRQNKLPRKKSPKTNGNSIEELAENNQYGIPPTDPAAYHL